MCRDGLGESELKNRNLPLTLFRILIALLSSAIGLAIAGQHLGVANGACGTQCETVRSLWFSRLFDGALLVVPLFSVVLLLRGDSLWYRRVAYMQGAAALVAISITVIDRLYCPYCMAAQSLWIFVALEALPKLPARLVAAPFLVVACFILQDALVQSRPLSPPVSFLRRNYEPVVRGTPAAMVIFTDPLCPYCRSDAHRFMDSASPLPVLYRWKLLPQHGELAVRLACLIESAKERDAERGSALQLFVYSGLNPPTSGEIEAAANQIGFARADVHEWLVRPEAESLNRIADDGRLATALGLEQVPSLCTVTTVAANSGSPRLRRFGTREMAMFQQITGKDFSVFNVFLDPMPRR